MLAEPKDRFRSSTAFSTSSGLFATLACFPLCSGVRLNADLGDGLVGVGGFRTVSGALNVKSEAFPGGWNVKMVCDS